MLLNDLFVQYREFESAKAMDYANQATKLSISSGFKKGESLLLLNKGVFLNLNGENDAGEKLIKQSLDIRVKINLYTEGFNEQLDSNVETVLYRVIQECVNNVIKHSGANSLDI